MNEKTAMEIIVKELKPFLNESGQLTVLPARHKKRLYAFYYIAKKMEAGREYTEMEINSLINSATEFNDPATIRRELYNLHLVDRTLDCKSYWKERSIPSISEFIAANI